jgi:hypothetical protein
MRIYIRKGPKRISLFHRCPGDSADGISFFFLYRDKKQCTRDWLYDNKRIFVSFLKHIWYDHFFFGGEARDIRAWDWICCYTHTITSSLSSEIFLYRLHPCNNNKGAAAWRYSICIINHVATRKKKSVILFLLFFCKKIKWHLYFWSIGMNWTNGSKWIKFGIELKFLKMIRWFGRWSESRSKSRDRNIFPGTRNSHQTR